MKMTPKRRELMFRVMDGRQEIVPYLYFLDRFKRCDDILIWLIENHFIGREFVAWSKYNFGNSMLDMAAFVISKLEKTNPRPIFYDKDVMQ